VVLVYVACRDLSYSEGLRGEITEFVCPYCHIYIYTVHNCKGRRNIQGGLEVQGRISWVQGRISWGAGKDQLGVQGRIISTISAIDLQSRTQSDSRYNVVKNFGTEVKFCADRWQVI
jgi:hypothetical protein